MKALITNNAKYFKSYEYTTPGTYAVTAPRDTTCKFIIVGAGAGGSSCHFMVWERGRNGGQGAMVTGTVSVTGGTQYTIVVGAGGAGQRIADNGGSAYGGNGGDTTAFGNTAGGGKGSGAHTGYYDGGSDWGGDGGTATTTAGCTGSNGANYSTASKYLTYGSGGVGNSSTAGNGQGGYARLDFQTDASDYTYSEDHLTVKVCKDGNTYKIVNT